MKKQSYKDKMHESKAMMKEHHKEMPMHKESKSKMGKCKMGMKAKVAHKGK